LSQIISQTENVCFLLLGVPLIFSVKETLTRRQFITASHCKLKRR